MPTDKVYNGPGPRDAAVYMISASVVRSFLLMEMKQQQYIPGVCNIGPAERKRRIFSGWIGLAATVVLEGLFLLVRAPAPWRLALFLPATGGATGFLQAAFHFCAAFGFGGVFNFGPDVGRTDTVMQAEFRRKDRTRALQIIARSAGIGVVVALAGYFSAG